MANLNITKIVHDICGLSQRLYHQDCLVLDGQGGRREIDLLQLGDFRFDLDLDNSKGVDWSDQYTEQGLFTSVTRGHDEHQASIMGHQGAVPADPQQQVDLPADFVLTATFSRPLKVSTAPSDPTPRPGEYAGVVLFDYAGTQAGVSGRITDRTGKDPQLHLNVLPLGKNFWPEEYNKPLGGFPPIGDCWFNQVAASANPSDFTVVLYVSRSAQDAHMKAWLYIGNKLVQRSEDAPKPVQIFAGMTSETKFDRFRVGIGTSQGKTPPDNPWAFDYVSSVYLSDFAIWEPISGYHRMKAVHSYQYAELKYAKVGSDYSELSQTDLSKGDLFNLRPIPNSDGGEVFYWIGYPVGAGIRRLQDGGLLTSGNRTITVSAPLAATDPVEEEQMWKLIPADDPADDSFYIVSKSSGYAMDVKGGSYKPGQPVILWELSGSRNQRWILIPERLMVPGVSLTGESRGEA